LKWNIGWGTIADCNMKCEFCYSYSTRKDVKQLGLDDWLLFVDNNYKSINSINYGTGENSLSKEWFSLVKYIGENYNFIKQALTTNGYLYESLMSNEEYKDIVCKYISEIDISLDFCNRERHNQFRGNNKAYDWVIHLLQFCQKNIIKSTIVFLSTNETLQTENLEGIFEVAKCYGAILRSNIYRPIGGVNEYTKKFIVDYKVILDALKWIGDHHKVVSLSDPLMASILTKNHFKYDPSGSESIRILSDGSITPSTYLISENFRKYNIKDKNVLEKINITNLGISNTLPEACKDCKYCKTCKGGVLDRRYLWYSSFDQRDPYCPFNDGNYEPDFIIKISNEENFSSVHDGYLPTMFFSV
jgi:radical SAM protein with 4Fe4S-binding SPASM domain